MTTIKLLFSATWRGGLWGLLAGSLLGMAYGAVFANFLFVFGWASQLKPDSLSLGAILQAFLAIDARDIPALTFAVLLMTLLGSIMGGIFGIPTGLVVGVLNGLLLGIITRIFFFPLRDARTYRCVVALISMVFTAIASWLCFFAIMLLYANEAGANIPGLAIFVALPALIAGVIAGFISQLGARWYEKLELRD